MGLKLDMHSLCLVTATFNLELKHHKLGIIWFYVE
jgi:hypothetical protein